MAKISYEEWCAVNLLNPKLNSSKKAYVQFSRAYSTQTFIKKLLERKQERVEVTL